MRHYTSEEYDIIRKMNHKIANVIQMTNLGVIISVITLIVTIFEPGWAGINPNILIALSLIYLMVGTLYNSAWIDELKKEKEEYIKSLDKGEKVKVIEDFLKIEGYRKN